MKKILSFTLLTLLILSLGSVSYASNIPTLDRQGVLTRLDVLPYAAISFPGREGNHVISWKSLKGRVGVYNPRGYLEGVTDIFDGPFHANPAEDAQIGMQMKIESNVDCKVDLEFQDLSSFGFGPWLPAPTLWAVKKADEIVGYAGYNLDIGERSNQFNHSRIDQTPYFIDGAVKIETISSVEGDEYYQGILYITVSK